MRNLNLALISILTLTACGQAKLTLPGGATLTVNTGSAVSSAFADVQDCPSNMAYIAAGIGYGAFCIDKATQALSIHTTVQTQCMNAGKELCGVVQMTAACKSGQVPGSTTYWTHETSGQSGPAVFGGLFYGTGCMSPGFSTISSGAPTNVGYCCSR